ESEQAYARIRNGTCTRQIRQGALCDTPRWHVRCNPLWRMSLRARLLLAAAGMGLYGAALVALQALAAPAGVLLATILGCTVIACYCAWWLACDVVGRLELAGAQFRRLASGLYDGVMPIDRDDEVGAILLGLKSVQVRLGFDVQDAERRSAEAARITRALDAAEVNMMIADDRLEVIYANPAMHALARCAEADLGLLLPEFSAASLLGTRLHAFHPDPERQRAQLTALEQPLQVVLTPGGRRFEVIFTPVFDARGRRVGVVSEWRDLTVAMNALARDVSEVVAAAAHGDFSRRICLDGHDGFLQVLGQGVNELLASTEASLRQTLSALAALAEGDLRPRGGADMEGLFREMQDKTNATLEQLAQMVHTIREASRD